MYNFRHMNSAAGSQVLELKCKWALNGEDYNALRPQSLAPLLSFKLPVPSPDKGQRLASRKAFDSQHFSISSPMAIRNPIIWDQMYNTSDNDNRWQYIQPRTIWFLSTCKFNLPQNSRCITRVIRTTDDNAFNHGPYGSYQHISLIYLRIEDVWKTRHNTTNTLIFFCFRIVACHQKRAVPDSIK